MGDQVRVDVIVVGAQRAGTDTGTAGQPVPQPSSHRELVGRPTIAPGAGQRVPRGDGLATGGIAAATDPLPPFLESGHGTVEVPAAVTRCPSVGQAVPSSRPLRESRHPQRLNTPPLLSISTSSLQARPSIDSRVDPREGTI